MAGTYQDQATLASMNEFIAQVRVAMVKRAVEKYYSLDPQPFEILEQAKRILDSGASDADRIALLVATSDPTIAAAAPAVPSDSATLAGVILVLDALLK